MDDKNKNVVVIVPGKQHPQGLKLFIHVSKKKRFNLWGVIGFMKPRDWIAMSVIGTSTFLIYTGLDGMVGGMMLMVVVFYFGNEARLNNGSRNDLSLLYKKPGKR